MVSTDGVWFIEVEPEGRRARKLVKCGGSEIDVLWSGAKVK